MMIIRKYRPLWLFLASISALLLILVAMQAADAPANEPERQNGEVIVFRNVHVLPMDSERVLHNQAVTVRDGRILEIGAVADVVAPESATVIEGDGRFLLPGLAEMHGHIPSADAGAQYIEDVLFLFVANGITTVRGMQGGAGQLELAQRVRDGEVVGPNLYLAGPGFSGGSVDGVAQAIERVRRQKEDGWHLLKVLPGLTREEYDAMARTANELNIRFAGHVPAEVGLVHALQMNQDTFDHLDGYLEHLQNPDGALDEAALDEIVLRTREAGAWVVPTMALWEVLQGTLDLETLETYEELQYVPADMVSNWTRTHSNRLQNPDFNPARARRLVENRQLVLKAMNEGGARILMGTDAPQQFSVPGFSLRRELERMTDAGMSPYQIIRSGTFNVGEYFRNEDTFGIIAPGMRADLILVDENPLEDIWRVIDPDGVMVSGRWFSRDGIDLRLAELRDRME